MDLTVINGLGPARREKLESSGVKTLDALAEADVEAVAKRADIPVTVLTDLHEQAQDLVALKTLKGLGDASLEMLAAAGVRSLSQLAKADVDELSAETGIEADRLHKWRREAGPRAAARSAVDAARGVERSAREARKRALSEWDNARVVLREGIQDARVKLEQNVVAEAKILPIRAKDNVERVLDQVKGNVVVLRERADTAVVRVEDKVYEGLPIFKEKLADAKAAAKDEVDEVRVRVQEIRDKRVLPEAGKLKTKFKNIFGREKEGA